MAAFLVSSCSRHIPEASSPGEVPEWVHVFPKGTFSGRDGRGPWRCDPSKVAAATLAHYGSADVPMDYDHQLERSLKNGQPAVASGWVKEFEAREDGLWARVDWTGKARAHIAAREYRYVSPTFYHDRTGEIHLVESIALTNLPDLALKALTAQVSGTANSMEDDVSLKTIREIFGMADSATDEEVFARAKHLTADVSLAKAAASRVEGELDGLKKAMAAKEAEAPDPSKFVPIKVFQDTAAELSCLKTQAAKEAAGQLVAEGVKDGKISPAMADWAKEYAAKDPDGFKGYLEKAPAVAPGHGGGKKEDAAGTKPPAGEDARLTDQEKAVCGNLGLSEADYIKARGSQNKEGA